MKYENKDKVDKICNDIAAKTEIVHSLRDKFRAINIVDGIPDEFKQEYILLRNDTAGTAGIYTPVETSTSASNLQELETSAVIEAGSQPI